MKARVCCGVKAKLSESTSMSNQYWYWFVKNGILTTLVSTILVRNQHLVPYYGCISKAPLPEEGAIHQSPTGWLSPQMSDSTLQRMEINRWNKFNRSHELQHRLVVQLCICSHGIANSQKCATDAEGWNRILETCTCQVQEFFQELYRFSSRIMSALILHTSLSASLPCPEIWICLLPLMSGVLLRRGAGNGNKVLLSS